jgi:hypothetical protein
VEAVEQNGGDALQDQDSLQDHDSSEGRGSRSTGTLKWFDPEKGSLLCRNDQPTFFMTERSSLINFPMDRWP